MREDFEAWALARQFDHAQRPLDVDVDRQVEPLHEVDRGGAVDDRLRFPREQCAVVRRQRQVVLGLVPREQTRGLTMSPAMGTTFSLT